MQEDFKKYIQSKMSPENRETFESRLVSDPEMQADFDLYRQAHFAIEEGIAEDLRNKLRGNDTTEKIPNSFRYTRWLLIAIALLLLGAALWTKQQAKKYSEANFYKYVQLEDQLSFRGVQNQDFLVDFKDAYEASDLSEMENIIDANKNHIQSANMNLMLAEKYWRKGERDMADKKYNSVHIYDLNQAGEKIPVGKSHLNQAYFYFKTGQVEKFHNLIKTLSDPALGYELQQEAEELHLLSKKPLARYLL